MRAGTVKPGKRKSNAKGGGPPASIDQYLARVPEPARSTLRRVRAAIRSAAPKGATETISYRIPAFRYGGILVWFAAFPRHCSLFPGALVLRAFRDELKGYSTSKGTIRFPVDRPLPVALVRRLVRARARQIRSSGSI